ncbi:MAG: GNAT family N-acetyltransferase [Acidobacteriota bacterium]|jgi:predicted N-acetyltransferase YhbS|nr:GNAT family N-acetyltransferase [Acidobacteriota bacterium]
MEIRYRVATAEDVEAILRVTVAAFRFTEDSPRYSALRREIEAAPQRYRVLEQSGEILASLHVGDNWIQVGQCAVLKGDIGHVAVDPGQQARGLGTMLMNQALADLRVSGYHLSRLGGLVRFYRRFGYEPFPRRFVEFRVKPVQGQREPVPAVEAYPPPSGYPGDLRPFDEASDWRGVGGVIHRFMAGRSGADVVHRPTTPPAHPAPPDPTGLKFVHDVSGQIRGVLFAHDNPLESTETERCFSIGTFAYEPDCPDTAAILLQLLFSRLAPFAPVRITSRLPFDEKLACDLHENGIGFERIEMHQAVGSNMIQVLNLGAIFDAIAPELEARLQESLLPEWSGVVGFKLPNESCALRVDRGEMRACDPQDATVTVELSQAQFVKALFGLCGMDELPCTMSLTRLERALLGILFPRCPSGSGPWG